MSEILKKSNLDIVMLAISRLMNDLLNGYQLRYVFMGSLCVFFCNVDGQYLCEVYLLISYVQKVRVAILHEQKSLSSIGFVREIGND